MHLYLQQVRQQKSNQRSEQHEHGISVAPSHWDRLACRTAEAATQFQHLHLCEMCINHCVHWWRGELAPPASRNASRNAESWVSRVRVPHSTPCLDSASTELESDSGGLSTIHQVEPSLDPSTIHQSTKFVGGWIASSITSGSLAVWSPVCRPVPVGGTSEVRPWTLRSARVCRD